MNAAVRKLPQLARQCVRKESTTVPPGYREGIYPDMSKIKQTQARFQVEDGKPVYLKGGPTDQMLFFLASASTVVSAANIGHIVFEVLSQYF